MGRSPRVEVRVRVQLLVQKVANFRQMLLRIPLTVSPDRGMDVMRGKCMNTFTIDGYNTIARQAFHNQSASEVEKFSSEKELAKLAAQWPARRLVEIWNRMAGVRRVTKFTDRKTGVRRVWTKAQELAPLQAHSPAVRHGTKAASVIALLREPSGATLEAIMAITGWQAHSVRGFISAQLTKKLGLRVQSFTRRGERVYRIRP